MDRLKILITGGNGYIAKSIHSYLYSKYDITLASRADLDLTHREKTIQYFSDNLAYVIYCYNQALFQKYMISRFISPQS